LIRTAPDIDAGDRARGQPARYRRQHGAAPTAHVEHALVTAQAEDVQYAVPLEELDAPRRVEEASKFARKNAAYSVKAAAGRTAPWDRNRTVTGSPAYRTQTEVPAS